MRSPTQRNLTATDIGAIVATGLGTGIDAAAELTGGGFATVWQATLTDGREVVVKVGPPASARLLTYEEGVVPAEAEYYALVRAHAPGVPVPEVLAVAPEWTIASRLPGRPLTDGDSPAARRDLGAAVARIHRITGSRFGYTGDRPAAGDWPTAFGAIMAALRADAATWNVPLPPLDGVLERHHDVLATVNRPALLHFDLWDGNVLVAPDGTMSGLVDGERYLYGDPLLDFVSPALFRRIEDEPGHPFLTGYGAPTFDRPARIRLALCRILFTVLMITGIPSRGLPDSRHDRLTGLLDAELARLAELS